MKRKRIDPRSATKIDKIIGQNLRRVRMARGISQTVLGDSVGITFQQVQKIENATNRLPASRLYEFARFLEAPIDEFFVDRS